jgi:hypothetical protein
LALLRAQATANCTVCSWLGTASKVNSKHDYLHDTGICCNGFRLEEDKCVQLCRRAARKLRVAVPVVQVGCQLPQRRTILRLQCM